MSTEANSCRSSLNITALEVRHSMEGLQLPKHFLDDGLQVVPAQPGLQVVPSEQLQSQFSPQLLYGVEKEACMEVSPLYSVEKALSTGHTRLKWIIMIACMVLLIVIIVPIAVVKTRKTAASQRFGLTSNTYQIPIKITYAFAVLRQVLQRQQRLRSSTGQDSLQYRISSVRLMMYGNSTKIASETSGIIVYWPTDHGSKVKVWG